MTTQATSGGGGGASSGGAEAPPPTRIQGASSDDTVGNSEPTSAAGPLPPSSEKQGEPTTTTVDYDDEYDPDNVPEHVLLPQLQESFGNARIIDTALFIATVCLTASFCGYGAGLYLPRWHRAVDVGTNVGVDFGPLFVCKLNKPCTYYNYDVAFSVLPTCTISAADFKLRFLALLATTCFACFMSLVAFFIALATAGYMASLNRRRALCIASLLSCVAGVAALLLGIFTFSTFAFCDQSFCAAIGAAARNCVSNSNFGLYFFVIGVIGTAISTLISVALLAYIATVQTQRKAAREAAVELLVENEAKARKIIFEEQVSSRPRFVPLPPKPPPPPRAPTPEPEPVVVARPAAEEAEEEAQSSDVSGGPRDRHLGSAQTQDDGPTHSAELSEPPAAEVQEARSIAPVVVDDDASPVLMSPRARDFDKAKAQVARHYPYGADVVPVADVETAEYLLAELEWRGPREPGTEGAGLYYTPTAQMYYDPSSRMYFDGLNRTWHFSRTAAFVALQRDSALQQLVAELRR